MKWFKRKSSHKILVIQEKDLRIMHEFIRASFNPLKPDHFIATEASNRVANEFIKAQNTSSKVIVVVNISSKPV